MSNNIYATQADELYGSPNTCHYCKQESWEGCWEKEPESTFGMRPGEAYPGQWICEECQLPDEAA
jgi:hypothetical protein